MTLPVPSLSLGSALWAILDTMADAELGREATMLEWLRRADASTVQALRHRAPRESDASVLRVVDGVGYLQIVGTLRRDPPWWAEFFDIEVRTTGDYENAVRAAIEDDAVHTLFTHIRSPGGETGFIPELADAVWEARHSGMRTVCYFDDLGASAAYWVGCQHGEVYCNAAGLLGSIGTYATVYDTSEAAAKSGVRVHVVKSSDLKGGAVPGAPVKAETLAEFQRLVDSTNALFLDAVARGRGVDLDRVEPWADARVHMGRAAVEIGLADGVLPLRLLWPALLERRKVDPTEGATAPTPTAQLPLRVEGETVQVTARALATPRPDATHWANHPESGDPIYFDVRERSADSTPSAGPEPDAPAGDQALEQLVHHLFDQVISEKTGAL